MQVYEKYLKKMFFSPNDARAAKNASWKYLKPICCSVIIMGIFAPMLKRPRSKVRKVFRPLKITHQNIIKLLECFFQFSSLVAIKIDLSYQIKICCAWELFESKLT